MMVRTESAIVLINRSMNEKLDNKYKQTKTYCKIRPDQTSLFNGETNGR